GGRGVDERAVGVVRDQPDDRLQVAGALPCAGPGGSEGARAYAAPAGAGATGGDGPGGDEAEAALRAVWTEEAACEAAAGAPGLGGPGGEYDRRLAEAGQFGGGGPPHPMLSPP